MNTNEQKQQFNLLQNVMDTTNNNEQNSMNVSLNHFDGLTASLNLSNAISLNNMNQQQHQQQQQQQQQVMKQLIDQNGQYNQNNGGIFIGI